MITVKDINVLAELIPIMNDAQLHPEHFDKRQLSELKWQVKNIINIFNCQINILDYEIKTKEKI